MKEKRLFLPHILIALSLFLPVATLIFYCFGYSVYLANYHLFSVISALVFIVSALVISKKNIYCKISAFLPMFSFINLAICLFKDRSVVALVCMIVCFICSAIIAEKACSSAKAKIASVITSAFLAVLIILVSIFCVGFGNFGQNTVVERIYSPEKTFYAEIIDSDQGALGGDTVVYVYKNSRLNLLVLTISKTPQRVYIGEWKEYESMQTEWKNENCLLINSKEYNIVN